MHRVLTALPVFNEERHVASTLAEVARFADHILVVDDGSTDGTHDVLSTIAGIEVVTHAVNKGYGAALVSAFEYAIEHGYDTLVTIDCDGQHEPALIPEIATQLANEPQTAFVSGSRYLKAFAGDSKPPEDRRSINRRITCQLNTLFSADFGSQLTDAFCGFKAYRVNRLDELEITELGYAMPLQLWVQAARKGWRVTEFAVPLVYLEEERSFGGALDIAQQRMAYYQEVLKRELSLQFGAEQTQQLEHAPC